MPFGSAIRGMAGQGQGLGPSQNMGGGNGLMGMMKQMKPPQGGQMVKGNANAMSKMFGGQPPPQQKQMPQFGMMPGNRMGQQRGMGLGPSMGMGRPMQQIGPPQRYNEMQGGGMGQPMQQPQELPQSPMPDVPQNNTQGQEIARGMGPQMGRLDLQQSGMGPSPQGIAQMFGRQRPPQIGMGGFRGY